MRTRFVAFAAATAAALFMTFTSASATVLISGDNGGRMEDYASRFAHVRQSGEQVVIDGPCLSACTMVLGMVPRNRVCATPNAVFGFHAAWLPDGQGGRMTSRSATRALMATYPPSIRALIARRGGLTPQMIFIRGRELAGIVPSCGSTPRATYTARAQHGRTVRHALGSGLRRAGIAAR